MADATAGTEPGLDPTTQKYLTAQKRAEARKATAEAQQAELKALLPTFPAEPPAETLTTPERLSPIGSIAVYKALQSAARHVASLISKEVQQHKVWVVGDGSLVQHRAVERDISTHLALFERALTAAAAAVQSAPPSQATAAPAMPGDSGPQPQASRAQDQPAPTASSVAALSAAATFAMSGVSSLVGLLRTNRTIRSSDVTIDEFPVLADVAQAVSAETQTQTVQVPGYTSIDQTRATDVANALQTRRDEVGKALAVFSAQHNLASDPELFARKERLATLRAILESKLKTNANDLGSLVDAIDEAARSMAERQHFLELRAATAAGVAELLGAIDEYLKAASTRATDGLSPLDLADAMLAFDADPDTELLVVSSSFAGGESLYEEKLVSDDRAVHYGAICLAFMLLDHGRTHVMSGVVERLVAGASNLGSAAVDMRVVPVPD